jgi:hypothetical protein
MNHFARGGEGIVIVVLALSVIVVLLIGMARLFKKADKPGWGCIVPIYNVILELEIIGKSPWLIFLALIPLVNIIFGIYLGYQIALAFGKSSLFCFFAAILGPFVLCIIGYDDSEYIGPSGIYPEFLNEENNFSGVAHA